ncbi:MAG: 3-phosphoshikimate 1-carboxyvinyltransferase [Oligosphaeraceae bacterium]
MSQAVLSPRSWRGRVAVPSSKSVAHRQLLCAALAGMPLDAVRLQGPASEDLTATRNALETLRSPRGEWPVLDCGESGSTLRFLLPVAAALGGKWCFQGRGRLPRRPLDPLLGELRAHGVEIQGEHLPLRLEGRLTGGTFHLPGNVSSQFVTGLLLALPLAGGGAVRLTSPLESQDYVTLTLQAMARFGVEVRREEDGFVVPPGSAYRPVENLPVVEGDWSAAAFPMVAAALDARNPQGLLLENLSPDSLQGDRRIVELLRAFGARVEFLPQGLQVRPAPLRALPEIDVRPIPDMVPALSVVAALAQGTTRFVHGERLRLKESDRLEASRDLVVSLGGEAVLLGDVLQVTGVRELTGGAVDGRNDHRIVMAAAAAAVAVRGSVTIGDAQAVAKSWPAFWQARTLATGEEVSL